MATNMIPLYAIAGVLVLALIILIIYRIQKTKGSDKKLFSNHVHKWRYMFSSNDNEWNWFHCEECLTQCCCKLDMQTGMIEVQTFNTTVKK